MTKERFKYKSGRAGLTGAPWNHTSRLLWIPETQQLIRFMYDTDGSQLIDEDVEMGCNDYIDYQMYDFDGTYIEEGDGGIYLFNNRIEHSVVEITWSCLEKEIFNGMEVPECVWLEDER